MRSTIHDRASSLMWAACMVFCAATIIPATAQTGDLATDVTQLNIRHKTEHYALAGTASDARLKEYGRVLEYIYKEYARGFSELLSAEQGKQRSKRERPAKKDKTADEPGGGTVAADAAGRFKVIIFANEADYQRFGQAYFGGRAEHTNGMFVPSVQLLLIRDDPDANETYETLFHEAFHQFVSQHIKHPPLWLNEGLATYFGTARPTASGLAFDRPEQYYFQLVRDAVALKKLIPFDELMAYGPQEFYSREAIETQGLAFDRTSLSYGQSYTLVAYLFSDPDGRVYLRKYIRELAKAESAAQAKEITRKSFTPKLLSDMTPRWLTLVNKH